MRRREFITLLGSAAVWPLAARAQQGGTPTIGLLWPADAPPVFPRMESFRQGLRASGLVEGQNVTIELRYAQRGPQQLPELAAEMVRSKVDVIFAGGDLAARVAQQATGTIHSHDQRRHHWRRPHRKSLAARWQHHRRHHSCPGAQREAAGDFA